MIIDSFKIWLFEICSLWSIWQWVSIGSGNGLLPDGTKPLPEPMLPTSVTRLQWVKWYGSIAEKFLTKDYIINIELRYIDGWVQDWYIQHVCNGDIAFLHEATNDLHCVWSSENNICKKLGQSLWIIRILPSSCLIFKWNYVEPVLGCIVWKHFHGVVFLDTSLLYCQWK